MFQIVQKDQHTQAAKLTSTKTEFFGFKDKLGNAEDDAFCTTRKSNYYGKCLLCPRSSLTLPQKDMDLKITTNSAFTISNLHGENCPCVVSCSRLKNEVIYTKKAVSSAISFGTQNWPHAHMQFMLVYTSENEKKTRLAPTPAGFKMP